MSRFPRSARCFAVSATILAGLLTSAVALAQSTPGASGPVPPPAPPLPPVALGSVAFLDAMGGPGTMMQVNTSAQFATRLNDSAGHAVPAPFDQNAQVALLHVAHTTKMRVLGALVGGEVLLPITRIEVNAGPMSQTATGVGDAVVGGYLQWTGGKLLGKPFAARLDLDLTVPTGTYSRSRLVNPGSRSWTVSPYLAWTWLPSERWEISNRINFTTTSKDKAPPRATELESWQPGNQLAVNLSTSYAVSAHWRIGAGGYALWQVSDSRTNDLKIANNRQRVFGAGPGLRWQSGRTILMANAYKEFGARNRAEGHQFVVRVMRLFN